MVGKEIKLEDAISEIVVADSNWELGAEGSNVDYFEEEQQQQLQTSAKSNQRLQQVADYQPGDCLKEGTQIFNLFLVQSGQQKVDHKIFFHLLDLTVLNSWTLLSACGAKYTDRDLRLLLVRN